MIKSLVYTYETRDLLKKEFLISYILGWLRAKPVPIVVSCDPRGTEKCGVLHALPLRTTGARTSRYPSICWMILVSLIFVLEPV